MGLYRKATPDELDLRGARVMLDEPVSTTSVSTKRKVDRHKDPKAHSAKTAARAKAKRCASSAK